MKTETKRMGAYVGLLLTFASAGFFASRRAFAVPIGDLSQCGATSTNCMDSSMWAYLGQKPVSCCCMYSDNPQVWVRCNSTIKVFYNLQDPTQRCYRELSLERTNTPCQPIPIGITTYHPVQTDLQAPNGAKSGHSLPLPDALPKGSCCNQ